MMTTKSLEIEAIKSFLIQALEFAEKNQKRKEPRTLMYEYLDGIKQGYKSTLDLIKEIEK